MMSAMAGRLGLPGGPHGAAARRQEGQEGQAQGPDAAEGARRDARAAGVPQLPAGCRTCRNMPKGLDQLPPGLEGFDLSKLDNRARRRVAGAGPKGD